MSTKFGGDSFDMLQKEILNVRQHPITTAARTTMGLSLNTNHKGIHVWDTDEDVAYYWNGVMWVSASGVAQYTDAQAQAAVGAIVDDTDTIDMTYASNTITASVRRQMSIVSHLNGIKLDGDVDTPGENKYYGTNSSGTKGWHSLPAGTDPGYTFTKSVILGEVADQVTLKNDEAAPGNLKYYGTNGAGVKGWYGIPNDTTFVYAASVVRNDTLLATPNSISLVNDVAVPGNLKYYGTNDSGTKGWYAFPASFGTSLNSFRWSLVDSGSGVINLTNDVEAPGNSKYYGTNGSGLRGWFDLPSGSSTSFAFAASVVYEDTLLGVTNSISLENDAAAPGNHKYYGTNGSGTRGWLTTGLFTNRIQQAKGAVSVASANDITLGSDGNLFTITGNTELHAITTTGWQSGSHVQLLFTGTPIIRNNTAGGLSTAPIMLQGSVDFQADASTVLFLVYDGAVWHEVSRKQTIKSGAYTFNNGLTEALGIVRLGGTLIMDTSINCDIYELALTGSQAFADGPVFKVTNSGSVGVAVQGDSTNGRGIFGNVTSGVGVYGVATSGYGLFGWSDSGGGLYVRSSTGLAGEFLTVPTSTNTGIEVLRLGRATSGTASDGIGGSIAFYTQSSSASQRYSNGLSSIFTTADDLTRVSQLLITGVNAGATVNLAAFHGTGVLGIGITSAFGATRLHAVDDSLGAASMVKLTSASTLASGGTSHKILDISASGANASSGQTTYGIFASNSHSGTSSTNIAIYGEVSNATSSGTAVYGNASGSLVGVRGISSSGSGVLGSSTSGAGVFASSVSGIALQASSPVGAATLSSSPSSTNTVLDVVTIQRNSSGTPAAGLGCQIQLQLGSSTNVNRTAGTMAAIWDVATEGSQTSRLRFQAVNAASTVDVLTLGGLGYMLLNGITATAASAITASNGMVVYVTDTNGTFTSVGFWGRENGAWVKL